MRTNFNPVFYRNPALIAAGAQAAQGIGQLISGIIQGAKAKKDARRLGQRPQLDVSKYYEDILNVFQQQATQGLGAAQLNYLNTTTGQSQAASIQALVQGGGNPNNIANILGVSADFYGKTALQDAQLQQANIQKMAQAATVAAEMKEKEFLFNQYIPYKDRQQAIAQRAEAAYLNRNRGVNTIVNAGANFLKTRAIPVDGKTNDVTNMTQQQISNSAPMVDHPVIDYGLPNLSTQNEQYYNILSMPGYGDYSPHAYDYKFGG